MEHHIPVLLNEVIDHLELSSGMRVVDGTVDGGGHAKEILGRIGPNGHLLGIDWDSDLLALCQERLKDHVNATLIHGNYADMKDLMAAEGFPPADAILLDLGFSSEQLAGSGKGLAFTSDEPLRMTYDPGAEPAYQILAEMSEKEILTMIRELGEERYAPKIARAIYSRERRDPIATTAELAEVVKEAVPGNYEHGRLNPATRTFQALRIYVNDELGNLRRFLASLPFLLAPNGRIAIISFHSLEDRIVKHEFRRLEDEGILKVLTKKPIEAGEEESRTNPRARSAKLRVAQKIEASN